MKSFVATSAALLSATTGALAQQTTVQSAPFQLLVTGGKYQNRALGSCHEGAAIEGLCTDYGSSVYQLNTTSGQQGSSTLGTPGTLTYALPIGNATSGFNESEPLNFFYSLSSDVALPLFEPANPNVQVAFDNKNRMNIQGYVDDTVTPPKAGNTYALYRWYVCETYYTSYTYFTLAWKMGKGKPENPSCVKVDVVRKFV